MVDDGGDGEVVGKKFGTLGFEIVAGSMIV